MHPGRPAGWSHLHWFTSPTRTLQENAEGQKGYIEKAQTITTHNLDFMLNIKSVCLCLCACVCVCRFEFSVSIVELHRRTLDVAVKNGGSILSKHKGLLGKVSPADFPCSGLRTDVFIAFRAINAGADSKHFLFFFFVFCLKLQVLVDLSGDDIAKGITQW